MWGIAAGFRTFPYTPYEILFGYFNAKFGKEDTFKPTILNESLDQESNDNGVRTVNFATSKNLFVKSTMFPHRNIHKYIWTCLDGKTHNQIDHILIDRKWHSSIINLRSVRGAYCETDYHHGRSHWGRDVGWRCLRKWCCGEYLILRETR